MISLFAYLTLIFIAIIPLKISLATVTTPVVVEGALPRVVVAGVLVATATTSVGVLVVATITTPVAVVVAAAATAAVVAAAAPLVSAVAGSAAAAILGEGAVPSTTIEGTTTTTRGDVCSGFERASSGAMEQLDALVEI